MREDYEKENSNTEACIGMTATGTDNIKTWPKSLWPVIYFF
jgi:hypothetical protein